MRELIVDLHNHTPHVASDYRDPGCTPDEYVAAAIGAGIDVLGVTDHFSVGFCRQVMEASERASSAGRGDVLVLPGAELKVRDGADEAHLIALFSPEDDFERRFEELLGLLGLPADLDVATLPDVVASADAASVARAVDSLGGICHVAHADRHFGGYRLLGSAALRRLAAEPAVCAIEMLDPGSAAAVSPSLAGIALIRSSDAHSPAEIGRRPTALAMGERSFEGLRLALRQARTATLV